jgi:hypothetical protein
MPVTELKPDDTTTAEFRLNILIENNEKMFVGWCIETGLAAVGMTVEDCAKKLIQLNCEHISFALENDNPKDIFHAPPSAVMNKFLMVAKLAQPTSAGNMDARGMFCTPLFSLHPAIYASASI